MSAAFALLLSAALRQLSYADGFAVDPDEAGSPDLVATLQDEPKPKPRLGDPDITGPWPTEWSPTQAIFRNYLADPTTPRNGTKFEIPIRKKDHVKNEADVGSQRVFFRCMNPNGDEGFDLGIEGAVILRFDVNEGYDLDSFDARWGFPLGYRKGPFTAKFHLWHLSSHIGDEFESRNDNPHLAIRYHRDEAEVAFAYDWTPEIRTYIDWGSAFYIGTPNKRWRGQAGAEWAGNVFWQGPPFTYIAVDVKWRQETDWDTAVTIQTGYWMFAKKMEESGGTIRLFLEYYQGRSAQTQFPDERDAYWAFGVASSL